MKLIYRGKLYLYFFILVFCCLSSVSVLAQFTYPVETRVIVTPPFPTTLSSFAVPGKVTGIVTLKDPNRTGLRVKIRLSIAAPDKGILITTRPGSELVINEGLVSGFPFTVDLSDMLKAENLTITPVSIIQNGGKLPDGVYMFNLEVIEGVSGQNQLLSNVRLGAQMFWITTNEPPFLNFPVNNTTIAPASPQNIVFQWTPRHLKSLNSGAGVKYTFRLVKVEGNQNPYQAFLNTSSPIFVAPDLQFPFYNYTQLDFKLTEGERYAWQVQAISESGQEEFSLNGYSEVFAFYYTGVCPPPVLPAITAKSVSDLTWNPGVNLSAENTVQAYSVQYRFSGSSAAWQVYNHDVTSSSGSSSFVTPLNMLETGKTYDIQIKAICKINESVPVYAGTAKNDKLVSCSQGAEQIVVKNDPQILNQKIVSWNPIEGATGYNIKKVTGGQQILFKTNSPDQTTITLNEFPVSIMVNAICDGQDKDGLIFEITSQTAGLKGQCKIPDPLGFTASDLGPDNKISVEWRAGDIFASYNFSYRLKGSGETDWVTQEVTSFPVSINAADGNTYEYRIKFNCDQANSVTSQNAYFQAQKPQTLLTDPTTGSCFPPVHLASEVTDKTVCEVICDKVPEAQKYEIAYAVKGTENWQVKTSSGPKFKLESFTENTAYTYKVRAICKDGNSIYSDTSGFNTHISPPQSGPCNKLAAFDTLSTTSQSITLSWLAENNYTTYAILYHQDNEAITNWHTLNVSKGPDLNITAYIRNLNPGKNYEIQIQAYCDKTRAGKSDVKTFRTRTSNPVTTDESFSCGASPNSLKPGACGKNPLPDKAFFTGGGFQILVDETSGSSPNGTGAMLLPYMNNALVKVTYTGVQVADNNVMCKGIVSVKSLELNVIGFDNAKKIQDFRKRLSGGLDAGQDALNQANDAINQGDQYVNGGQNVGNVVDGKLPEADKKYSGSISTVEYNASSGDLKINGNIESTAGKTVPLTIQDKDGKTFLVDAQGKVTNIGTQGTPLTEAEKTAGFTKGKVLFSEAGASTYSFDAYQDSYKGKITVAQEYPDFGTAAAPYFVSSKLMVPKETDKVLARITGAAAPDKITFVSGKGMVYNKTVSGNTFTITLIGGKPSDAQDIYAIYTEGSKKVSLGKLLVPCYTPQNKDVILVSVCDTRITDGLIEKVQKTLDNVYGRIGIKYNVFADDNFKNNQSWDAGSDCVVQDKGSNLISNNYTGEEKALVQAYIASKGGLAKIPAETAYFFVNKETSRTGDLLGKMPRGDKFGFLFTGSGSSGLTITNDVIARTAAHELGHGVHILDHTFDKVIGLSEGSTNNIMDYTSGQSLYKFQWDRIYDPGHVIGILDSDEDALAVAKGDVKAFLEHIQLARKSGISLTLNASSINSDRNWSQDNIQLETKLYKSTSVKFEQLSANLIFNPVLYEDFVDKGILNDDYGFYLKDNNGKRLVTVISESYSERENLKKYLFGNCDFREILESIHLASAKKSSMNFNYLPGCGKISILKSAKLNDVEYEELICSFNNNMVMGTYVNTTPHDNYTETANGFEIRKGNDIVFTINYFKGNIDNSIYADKKAKLKEWLFGSGAVITQTNINGKVNVSLLSFSDKGIEFLKKQEGVVTHVYNDAKGGKSKYCVEHKDHSELEWYCKKDNHYGKNSKGDKILGKPTIGLGHLIVSQTELDSYCSKVGEVQLSIDECWTLFKTIDLPKYEIPLKAAIDVPITQYQYDALVSFVFNTGTGKLRTRGIFKLINAGDFDQDKIEDKLNDWDSPAIIIDRRNDEINLFNNGLYTFKGVKIK